ncbi:hypothetical protein A2J01_33580 [Rhodococcus sp. EPR-134]|nr:hypothetical protein A2J01_33580 [Rhodococcus sp. EPR-134]
MGSSVSVIVDPSRQAQLGVLNQGPDPPLFRQSPSAIVDNYWETAPLLSAGIAVAVLGVVNGLPSLIVTLMHNRRPQQG